MDLPGGLPELAGLANPDETGDPLVRGAVTPDAGSESALRPEC